MEYQVIARRYRPMRFDEVVGQEAIAATLRNAILQDRLAHAYLFCGPRGVGKTSMARIFARALNCPAAADRSRPESDWGIPCTNCEVCRAVHAGEDIDVVEMDGASHRGIEDIRDLIENVKFTPTKCRYKIYIVDEVHMLTREAFNALLKVLEEPPAHVKFIFATTEPHKIPETVLSRCQRFDFHPIGEAGIVQRLRQICENEKVTPEPGLLEKIALYGKGGLRDAQTLLDQLISFSFGALRLDDLERITGRLPEERLEALVAAIQESRSAAVLELLEEFFRSGNDPAVILEQLMDKFRAVLKEKLLKEKPLQGGAARASAPPAGGGQEAAALDRIVGSLQILHDTASRLKGSPHPQLALEIALVKLARLEDPASLEEAIQLLRQLEAGAVAAPPAAPREGAASGGAGGGAASGAKPAPRSGSETPVRPMVTERRTSEPPHPEAPRPELPGVEAPASEPPRLETARLEAGRPEPVRTPPAAPALEKAASPGPEPEFNFAHLRSLWDQILIEFRERSPELQAFLKSTTIAEREHGVIQLAFNSEFPYRQMSGARRVQMLEELIREVSGAPWRVRPELHKAADNLGDGAGMKKDGEPPLRENPLVKKSVELFRGRIV